MAIIKEDDKKEEEEKEEVVVGKKQQWMKYTLIYNGTDTNLKMISLFVESKH